MTPTDAPAGHAGLLADLPVTDTSPPNAPAPALPDAFVAGLRHLYEAEVPFNRVLGFQVDDVRAERVQVRIARKPELIGNFGRQWLHGGVICSALDAMGSLAILAAMADRDRDVAPADILQRFFSIGTIDLRVDFMRPCKDSHFLLYGEVLRLGGRIANTRMSIHSPEGRLLSTGTGVYIVS